MIQIVNLSVSLPDRDGPVVEWELLPTLEDISLYRFIVERSESPESDFKPVSSPLIDRYLFKDRNFPVPNEWRSPYYRIHVRNSATGEEEYFGTITQTGADNDGDPIYRDFGPASIGGDPDFVVLEIVRRNNLLLRRFTGTPVSVLIERTFGQRCQECFDYITQRNVTDQCRRCYNTGWIGGFHQQINTYANFHPRPVATSINQLQEQHAANDACFLSNLPRVKPRDIIVDAVMGERWRVVSVQTTMKRAFLSRQTCNITSVSKLDIEQSIPVEPFTAEPDVLRIWSWRLGSFMNNYFKVVEDKSVHIRSEDVLREYKDRIGDNLQWEISDRLKSNYLVTGDVSGNTLQFNIHKNEMKKPDFNFHDEGLLMRFADGVYKFKPVGEEPIDSYVSEQIADAISELLGS